jgi:hypothetical protein
LHTPVKKKEKSDSGLISIAALALDIPSWQKEHLEYMPEDSTVMLG